MENSLAVYDVSVLMPDMSISFHQTVEVREDRIVSVRPYKQEDRKNKYENELEGRGKLLMPGLCDCHMHTGQQLLKGKILDELPMIWTRIMLPFESMESAASVYEKTGLRGVLSASTMDDEKLPASILHTAEEALEQTERLYAKFHGKGNLKVAYSLRSLISCSEELILKVSERAKEKGALLQAHMNEYPNEINFFLEKKQLRPFAYLEKLGVLDSRFIGSHSILLSEKEKDILKKYDVKVCHCPFSNCGKGIPDTPALLQRGISTGLGTDGAAHGGLSLWNEMKIFRSVMNVGRGVLINEPALMPAKEILKMATKSGYEVIGEDGGSIEPGKKADFITINMMQPHLYPTENPVNTLLECVTAGDVCDSVVNGKILMRDRKLQTIDEMEVMEKAKEYMERQEKI